eukprot:1371779-Rhodomonas_salina.3
MRLTSRSAEIKCIPGTVGTGRRAHLPELPVASPSHPPPHAPVQFSPPPKPYVSTGHRVANVQPRAYVSTGHGRGQYLAMYASTGHRVGQYTPRSDRAHSRPSLAAVALTLSV